MSTLTGYVPGTILAVAVLLSAPASATALTAGEGMGQDHRPEHGPQEMHGQAMMMGMMEGPQLALRERERLDLSEDQIRQLESVQERLHGAHMEAMGEMQAVHREIEAAAGDDLDEARARAALERMAEMHVEVGLSILQARQETRDILTDHQRQMLAEVVREHMHRMHEMMERMPGMMMPGMMMPGMMGPGHRGPPGDDPSPHEH